jgi:hypothetical protein
MSIRTKEERFQKDIAHASHYWPSRKEKGTLKNLSKEAVGACLESSRLPSSNRRQEKTYTRSKQFDKKKKLQNNDALCSTPEPKPQIFSHTAHEKAQISNISRQR